MIIKRIRIMLIIVALMMVSIIGFVRQFDLVRFTYTLVGVTLIFAVIGSLVQYVVSKNSIKDHLEGQSLEPDVNTITETDNDQQDTTD